MKLEKLYLEVTRMCTLECEHCLRGDREQTKYKSNINELGLVNSLVNYSEYYKEEYKKFYKELLLRLKIKK